MVVTNVSRTSVSRETARRLRRSDLEIGVEVRRLRCDAGVTLTELARVVGVHRSHIARIEAGVAHPSLAVLISIGIALGADLSVKFFSGSGPRLHDRFQAVMVETLLRELDGRWMAQVEVPITKPSRGVIDLVLTDRLTGLVVAVEVQSELRRLEEQLRWSAEKADGLAERLGRIDPRLGDVAVSRLLVLRSTISTRQLANRYRVTLAAAYPATTAAAVEALTSAGTWPGASIVWMHVAGDAATLMRFPPRGVGLGR
jgi:transcriptional regulator with XRE-family HTH domain